MYKNALLFIIILLVFSRHGYSATKLQISSHKTAESNTIQKEQQTAVALAFINAYVKNCNKIKNATEVATWVNSNKLTTASFKSELKNILTKAFKANPEIGLDFDPLFDA